MLSTLNFVRFKDHLLESGRQTTGLAEVDRKGDGGGVCVLNFALGSKKAARSTVEVCTSSAVE